MAIRVPEELEPSRTPVSLSTFAWGLLSGLLETWNAKYVEGEVAPRRSPLGRLIYTALLPPGATGREVERFSQHLVLDRGQVTDKRLVSLREIESAEPWAEWGRELASREWPWIATRRAGDRQLIVGQPEVGVPALARVQEGEDLAADDEADNVEAFVEVELIFIADPRPRASSR